MNNVTLVGRIVAKPELRYVPSTGTAVANFTVAINREYQGKDGKRETDFIDVQVWNKQAESCEKYLDKGNMVSVNGSIRVDKYDDKQGVRRISWKINANRVNFLTPTNKNSDTQSEDNTPVFEPHFDDVPDFSAIDDSEMPF